MNLSGISAAVVTFQVCVVEEKQFPDMKIMKINNENADAQRQSTALANVNASQSFWYCEHRMESISLKQHINS